MNAPPIIFDLHLVQQHIARALPLFSEHNALFDDTGAQLQERIADVRRDFSTALDLSSSPFLSHTNCVVNQTALLDDKPLPFDAESFDLIASNLGLHWINDVPGALAQIHAMLKPEGMFVASLIGEQSLYELRSCLLDAELSVTAGISPRFSPTIGLLTASQLLQRAGFNLPVADKETVTLLYSDMFSLMHDLRGMGQSNAHMQRLRRFTRRDVFLEAARLYQERFATKEGHIPATFDIIYLHGWK